MARATSEESIVASPMGLGRCEATGLQSAAAARQGELLDLGKKIFSEAGLGGEARLAGQINLDRFKSWFVNVKDPLLKTVLFFFGGSISMKLTNQGPAFYYVK